LVHVVIRSLDKAALAAICLCAGGCQKPPPAPSEPAGTVFRDDQYGLSMEVPRGWVHTRTGQSSHVFSGPKGGDSFYTTITLQLVEPHEPLDVALERAYAAAALDDFAWERREPTTLDGKPALRYGVRLVLHETPRRKAGVLVDTGTRLIDISYGSTAELFDEGLPAFDTALDSISFY